MTATEQAARPHPIQASERSGAVWYVAAAVLLGAALQRNFGFYDVIGVVFVVLALVAGFAGLYRAPVAFSLDLARVLKIALLAELLFAWIGRQGQEILLESRLDLRLYLVAMAVISVAVLAQLAGRLRSQVWGLPVVLVATAALGVWTIQSSPSPHIDVFVFQKNASDALLHGLNPYQTRFPDIYGPGSAFYGPGLTDGHQTLFGFPYPPLSLLLAAAGHAVAGDFRYALLVAFLATGVLIWAIRRDAIGAGAAQLLLLAPTNLFLLEEGWNEPLAAALFVTFLFFESRRSRVAPIALGLLMAVKQYLFGVPALAYIVRRRTTLRRALFGSLIAVLVSLGTTLPFLLAYPRAFFTSVITLQLHQPFRADSLTIGGVLHAITGWEIPAFVGFVALAVAFVLSARAPSVSTAGLAGTLAVTYLAFFAFGRWGFGNYYWFVMAAFCAAVSGTSVNPALAAAQASG